MTVVGDPITVRLAHYADGDVGTLQARLVLLELADPAAVPAPVLQPGDPAGPWDAAAIVQDTASGDGAPWIYAATRATAGLPAGTYQAQWRRYAGAVVIAGPWADDDEISLTAAVVPGSLLARVNARVEHDLPDDEIQSMIDAETRAIEDMYGLVAPITATLDGHRKNLDVTRPIDQTQPIVVTEQHYATATPVVIAGTDYLIRNGGRTLERIIGTGVWLNDLDDGEAYVAGLWARRVTVAYTPINDSAQRAETIIRLVQLAVAYDGVKQCKAGDVSSMSLDYSAERDALLRSLAPRRHGLLMA